MSLRSSIKNCSIDTSTSPVQAKTKYALGVRRPRTISTMTPSISGNESKSLLQPANENTQRLPKTPVQIAAAFRSITPNPNRIGDSECDKMAMAYALSAPP